MELSKQVCTLEQAKKLKELGIKQAGLYMYYGSSVGVVLLHKLEPQTLDNEWGAFTVAELGVMLPDCVSTNSSTCGAEFISRKSLNDWSVGYDRDMPTEGGYGADVKSLEHSIGGYEESEASVRANMLIYLLENNLVFASDCNTRLISN